MSQDREESAVLKTSLVRRLYAKTKVMEADLRCSIDKFSNSCTCFGLTIYTKKTEVLHQPAPGKPYVGPNIKVNGQKLNVVNRFTYLGSTLSQGVTIDKEVRAWDNDSKGKEKR